MTAEPDIVVEARKWLVEEAPTFSDSRSLIEPLAAEVGRLRAELGEEKGLTPQSATGLRSSYRQGHSARLEIRMTNTLTGIKGFNADLQCRGFQFSPGQTYKHDGKIVCCQSGFHAVTGHPLAVFDYYAPAGSRFFRVELSGTTHSGDQIKTAAEILAVGTELGITDLVTEAIAWVVARSHPEEGSHATGDQGASSALVALGAPSSATGDRGASSATGTRGASSATGDQGASSATGTRGASSATGDQGASSATGDRGASSATGDQGASSATGTRGAALSIGFEARVMGAEGNALFALERAKNGDTLSVACGIVGKEGIEAAVWYRCVAGKLVPA